jgi:uncharacterized protein YeaO (DUF488 family)
MAIHVVKLGSPRVVGEGVRIGTVRRPPRGVKKTDFASGNWFDTWFPVLAPSEALVKVGLAAKTDKQWAKFAKRYRREMAAPPAAQAIALLVLLSRSTTFSVGCYCEDESRCHRSILKEILAEQGARFT